jgi:hypothetical protein
MRRLCIPETASFVYRKRDGGQERGEYSLCAKRKQLSENSLFTYYGRLHVTRVCRRSAVCQLPPRLARHIYLGMSVHYRSVSSVESDAQYQPIAQAETATEQEPNDLQPGAEDDRLADEFVAHEHVGQHDKRIGWIHLVLGCAVLLPWNGTAPSSLTLVF